ncbi:MAG: hypothetical protein D8M57_13655 [Candidatus Scalindua sp. AMX11]|nr:MAG: hypothetical protein DWQ00_06165 [Candidatus Scalindua sp.]NOG83429.1 hypothetical protein [Planctomycetota bacterium]RZV75060.1 MAG: hypothetical protein EX341_12690 [Candidatus Scalindua sp. SCAELEC01]TDE64321.1 MAG: hypothetical protein D8M57_13655 [Candidatus Scalindua sp. AMX11]
MAKKTEKKRSICNNCHNQHGCLTAEPFCLLIERKKPELSLSGKDLMKKRGRLRECKKCAHFDLCWAEETYKLALRRLKSK